MIKCIMFDIGGVIVDFYNDDDYYPYLARVSGKPVASVKRIIDYDVRIDLDKGRTTQRFFDRQAARQLGIEEQQIRYYEFYKKKAKLFKGTVEIIKKLRGKYTLAWLSNTDRSRYTWTVEKLLKPYLNLFSYRFASCDIKMRKPGKEIYKYALRHMKMENGEVIFIDNQIENVVASRKLGIRSIWFKSSKDLRKRLSRMGVEA